MLGYTFYPTPSLTAHWLAHSLISADLIRLCKQREHNTIVSSSKQCMRRGRHTIFSFFFKNNFTWRLSPSRELIASSRCCVRIEHQNFRDIRSIFVVVFFKWSKTVRLIYINQFANCRDIISFYIEMYRRFSLGITQVQELWSVFFSSIYRIY